MADKNPVEKRLRIQEYQSEHHQKQKAERALHKARMIEETKISSGAKYKRINPKTIVLCQP